MTYIISLYAAVLALGIWQEQRGSGHSEGELGSKQCLGCPEH